MSALNDIRQKITQTLLQQYDAREAGRITELLLCKCLHLQPYQLVLHTAPPDAAQLAKLNKAMERLQTGEPLQYVLGVAPFWDMELAVNPSVLIPRQETEELARWIVAMYANADTRLRILDAGTGSGCLALALARHLPCLLAVGVDVREDTLATARHNATLLNLQNVAFRMMDILQAGADDFSQLDIIVSNPPYIPVTEEDALHVNVRKYEPREALFVPEDDPLVYYQQLARLGRKWLKPGGQLFFEVYELLAEDTRGLLQSFGYQDIELRADLNGKPRMLRGRLPVA